MSEEYKLDKNGVLRNSRGHPAPGQSINPNGKPKTLFPDGRGGMISAGELFRRDAAEVHERLMEVIRDRSTPAGPLVSACKEIFDRAFGRPAQAVHVSTKRDTSLAHDMSELTDEQLEALALIKTTEGESEAE